MAQQLLAEDAQEKQAKGAPKATKSAKGKKVTMSRAAAAAPSAATSAAPAKPPSSGGASATKPASDAALRDAMAAGDLDGLSAALEEHRAFASEDVLRETRALRDRLKERRKQKSQRLRRSHPGAMEALARLQGCASEADALREGIAAAEALAGELPALDAELTAARARLEELSIGHSAASAAAPASELASAEAGQAVELTVEDLAAATGGFADQNQIGSGGFGRVYLAAADKLPLASLPAHMRHLSLAVKRAKSYHSGGLLGKLKGEVKMLKDLDHPHLLPLLGYCLSEAAPCLISPLMCGGSLKIRLRPADADPEQLRLLGLTPSLLPLNWTQRVKSMSQALEALLYLHSRSIWHRVFKPDNIFLDENLVAYLADTGLAKDAAPDASGNSKSKSHMLYGSSGYMDPSMLNGRDASGSALTDGFAAGVTLLVVLTNRSPFDIFTACELEFEDEFEELDATRLADPTAGWPAHAATTIKSMVRSRGAGHQSLCHQSQLKRLKLIDAHQALVQLLEDGEWRMQRSRPSRTSDAPPPQPLPEPTALSKQVRGMRTGGDAQKRIQDNMLLSFTRATSRLNAVYAASAAVAPESFEDKINFWRRECGMPTELKDRLHVLRKWSNAARHDDAATWRREGPSSEAEALQLSTAVDTAIEALES